MTAATVVAFTDKGIWTVTRSPPNLYRATQEALRRPTVRPPTLLETEASVERANAIYESCIDRGEETRLDAPLRGYYL
jgi:hypothetical protein